MIFEHRVADARQLIRQRTRSLIVISSSLYLQRPLFEAIDLSARPSGHRGGPEYCTSAVGEQHPKIAVSAFGDAPQVSRTARGVLLGREPKPAGEVTRISIVTHLARSRRDHRGVGK